MNESDPPTENEGENKARMPLILGRRHAAAAAAAAAIADGALIARADTGTVTKVLSVLFMGVFTYVGFRFITKIRYSVRPPRLPPSTRNASDPPSAGGWANPTGVQTFLAKLRKPFRK